MKGWNERSALSPGGNVAAAEVRHHVDAGQLRKQRWSVDLHGVTEVGTVPHGLAVRADRADFTGLAARPPSSSAVTVAA